MRRNMRLMMIVSGFLLSIVLSGCATVQEMAKGFVGVSTRVLEDERTGALKKTFDLDYNGCYVKVKEILKGSDKAKESPIYAQDDKKKMLAVYLTGEDTTPVGIFFTEEANKTLIEVSSPSIYAKEEIAGRIFTGIDMLLKPKGGEKKADVKEAPGN